MKVGRLEIADENLAAGIAALSNMREQYEKMPSVGERFLVPREEGKLPVPVLIYRPKEQGNGKLPVLFHMHGGAWVAGDAILLESFCQLLADRIPAVVVNINYHKADVIPISEMSKEACDCVTYFAAHGDEFGIDADRMAIGGHSAGANLAAGTVLRLMEKGISMKLQMLDYPCLDLRFGANGDELDAAVGGLVLEDDPADIHLSPLAAADETLAGVCPAMIIACGPDELRPHAISYAKRLIENDVDVYFREYPKAEHGFVEVNRPEAAGDERNNEEQAVYARDCEEWMIKVFQMAL